MKSVIIAILILLSTPFAFAQEAEKPAYPVIAKKEDASPLRPAQIAGRVDQIIDSQRLRLKDGRIIQLSGLFIPGGAEGEQAEKAKMLLDELFKNDSHRDVILYETPKPDAGRTTRMGHHLMHVVRKDGTIWLQGALIQEGLAYAWPNSSNPELAEQMFAIEQTAIESKKNIWADDSPHRLLNALEKIDPSERNAVIDGKIQKIAMVNNVTYLNFGNDYKTDFTVALPAPVRQAMTRKGQDVFHLQGKNVRVRGWMRPYNGPMIELEHPVLLQQEMKGHDATGAER